MGSSTHANKLGLSMLTKHSNYRERSDYWFTLSLSPSRIVFCARFLMLSHALAICSPTCAYTALLFKGMVSRPPLMGCCTLKYLDLWP
jgi:hypothetical protein